jgi:hypothetical protein
LIPVPCLALPQMQIEVEAVIALHDASWPGRPSV